MTGSSLPFLIGILFMAGIFLLTSQNILRLIVGFLILSQATNLFLFLSGGLTENLAPIIPGSQAAYAASPETLSQALILTAIVIGFGTTSFLVTLSRKCFEAFHTDDPDDMRDES